MTQLVMLGMHAAMRIKERQDLREPGEAETIPEPVALHAPGLTP